MDDSNSAINVGHNEERCDQNIELAPDTSQSELPADGECHCAKVLCPETDSVKTSVSFILM